MTAELYKEILAVIDERVREITVTREDFDRLGAAMARLAEAQARTDQSVEKLAEAQARTDQTVERLAQAQVRTEERLTRLEEAVEKLVQAQARFERTFETRLGALGARWGLDTEAGFRQGMRAILEDVGFRVERYLVYDKEGKVFDHPDEVELDVVVRDGKLMLIEIKSSASRADVAIFNRKVRFYEEREGTKAARRMLISPFVEEGARKLALALDTEIYTRADDLAKSQVEG
jgi:hypothetical protein